MANLLAVVTSENRHHELLDEILDMMSKAVAEHREAIKRPAQAGEPMVDPGAGRSGDLQAAARGAGRKRGGGPPQRVPSDPQAVRRGGEPVHRAAPQLARSRRARRRAQGPVPQQRGHRGVRRGTLGVDPEFRGALCRRPGAQSPGDPGHGITSAGDSLLNNAELRAELDQFLTDQIASTAEKHRDQIADLVARTVAAWDPDVAAKRLELAVGSDLQFIRINGTLVGGLVGLILHALKMVLYR